MNKIIIALSILPILACEPTEQEKQQLKDENHKNTILKANEILNLSFTMQDLDLPEPLVKEDSVRLIYNKISVDSSKLKFATKIDSIISVYRKIERSKGISEAEYEKMRKKKLYNKLRKEHPNWSKEDCVLISQRFPIVGMTLEMLRCVYGKPTRIGINDNLIIYHWDNYFAHAYANNDSIVNDIKYHK